MTITEHGDKNAPKILFIATAALEPDWAFNDAVNYLAEHFYVYAYAASGHDGKAGDFVSVEHSAEEISEFFKQKNITSLYGGYGLSMGGAILLRFLSTSGIKVEKAILDGAIMPYSYPKFICKMILAKDYVTMRALVRNRKLLEFIIPPEKGTPEGHNPQEEYDALFDFYKTSYSNKSIKNDFWSANNYELPTCFDAQTKVVYWLGEKEKRARKNDIKFVKNYLPKIRFCSFKGINHGELVMIYPKQWAAAALKFFKLNN